jgi:signal peptidase I
MWCLAAEGAAGCLLAWVCRRQFLVVTVSGHSMQPTLAPGDRLLVCRTRLKRVHAGQIAVVDQAGLTGEPGTAASRQRRSCDFMIKRVGAVPGDRIPPTCLHGSVPTIPPRVPDGMFYVLGDNPRRSFDSRLGGPVGEQFLVGVAVRRIVASQPRSRSMRNMPNQ